MLINESVLVEEAVNCPLCGTQGSVLYADLRDRRFNAPGLWSLLRCPRCRHVWLNPTPAPDEMEKLYTSYFTHESSEKACVLSANDGCDRVKRGLLQAMGYDVTQSALETWLGMMLFRIPMVREATRASVMFLEPKKRGRLLDVGCGNGAFLAKMRTLGWDVLGVEADSDAASLARNQHNLTVIEGSVEEVELPSDTFDAITLNHVIEHVRDPIEVLGQCGGSLRPGGTIVVKTPNVDAWGHRTYHDSWVHLHPPQHLHLFSMDTLKNCVERAGLSVKKLCTSALSAPFVYDSARSVRRTGRFSQSAMSFPASLGGYVFQIVEEAILRFRDDAGEEILLLATTT